MKKINQKGIVNIVLKACKKIFIKLQLKLKGE